MRDQMTLLHMCNIATVFVQQTVLYTKGESTNDNA